MSTSIERFRESFSSLHGRPMVQSKGGIAKPVPLSPNMERFLLSFSGLPPVHKETPNRPVREHVFGMEQLTQSFIE